MINSLSVQELLCLRGFEGKGAFEDGWQGEIFNFQFAQVQYSTSETF